jgi:hypothetical protein
MSNFIGIIENIEEENIGTIYYKKVVTIKKENEIAFFEFRNRVTMKFLETFKNGDSVIVTYLLQGKKTKAMMRCNNLVAQTIEKL